MHGDGFGHADLSEVDVANVALHGVALHFFDDGRVLVVTDVQFEHGVEAGRTGECDTKVFAIDGDGNRRHAATVNDGGNLVL